MEFLLQKKKKVLPFSFFCILHTSKHKLKFYNLQDRGLLKCCQPSKDNVTVHGTDAKVRGRRLMLHLHLAWVTQLYIDILHVPIAIRLLFLLFYGILKQFLLPKEVAGKRTWEHTFLFNKCRALVFHSSWKPVLVFREQRAVTSHITFQKYLRCFPGDGSPLLVLLQPWFWGHFPSTLPQQVCPRCLSWELKTSPSNTLNC